MKKNDKLIYPCMKQTPQYNIEKYRAKDPGYVKVISRFI